MPTWVRVGVWRKLFKRAGNCIWYTNVCLELYYASIYNPLLSMHSPIYKNVQCNYVILFSKKHTCLGRHIGSLTEVLAAKIFWYYSNPITCVSYLRGTRHVILKRDTVYKKTCLSLWNLFLSWHFVLWCTPAASERFQLPFNITLCMR